VRTKIAIHGACGQMGRALCENVFKREDTDLVGAIEHADHPLLGSDMHAILGHVDAPAKISLVSSIDAIEDTCDVIIDFSLPEAHGKLLKRLQESPIPLVVGTTGLSAQQESALHSYGESAPLVYASNMSIGVTTLFYLTKLASEKIGLDFDIEIIEAHHRRKHDAPSGTARTLGQIVTKARGWQYEADTMHGRSGDVGKRPQKQVGMHAVRAGGIVGDHSVVFCSEGERIELKHMAHSRSIFASGAVTAACWLKDKRNGLYDMHDVLDLH